MKMLCKVQPHYLLLSLIFFTWHFLSLTVLFCLMKNYCPVEARKVRCHFLLLSNSSPSLRGPGQKGMAVLTLSPFCPRTGCDVNED